MRHPLPICLAWLLLLSACASYSSDTTVSGGGGAAAAGGLAATAGIMWAITGCRLQGCPYGSYCDEKDGFCKVVTCGHGCPKGKVCNEALDRCQDMPPAQAPSDFLPQDDRINRLPGN